MDPEIPPAQSHRFEPRAARAMADMFDDVSGRYDLLNRLMTLGRDGAWREAMWAGVPEDAHAVLDLCTGSGVSLSGLRRPGRLVMGMDVSLAMLNLAAEEQGRTGWAPRLACADAFHLPLRDASLDAVTVAFGVRNLRPRESALAEMARVLRPGGVLSVLEATAPGGGAFAPFHRFWLRHGVPALGHLSPDPSAYHYLSDSIVEFGDGRAFESALAAAGFELVESRPFMLGAARLWVAERRPRPGEGLASRPSALQDARAPHPGRGEMPHFSGSPTSEWRMWSLASALTSAALTVALAWGTAAFFNERSRLPLEPWQERGLEVLLLGGTAGFLLRSIALTLRAFGPRPRR
jgi:demethylmenaquinone methyltransferase / 2-methoxy-6-polyprenyl-1,4-benzoquinol methylase